MKSNVYSGAERSFGFRSAVFRFPSSVFRLRSLPSVLRPVSSGSRGMTLLELLLVISVMAILAALLFPAFSKIRNAARERQAEVEVRVIGQAIAAYRLQMRGALPADPGVYWDAPDADGENAVVMDGLLDADPPVFDPNKLRWDDDGNVLNPWGNQYKITLESGEDDFDNQASKFYTEVVYSGMP